jgi:gliding motility associated protien GldN
MRSFALLLISLLGAIGLPAAVWSEETNTQGLNTSQEAVSQEEKATVQFGTKQTALDLEEPKNPYLKVNPNSLNPIPQAHIMFRRRVWREMYLREKQNKPFFSRGKEITKLIIDGVKEGILMPYVDDSLTTQMPINQFWENLSLPKEEGLSAEEKALGFTDDIGWGDKQVRADITKEEEQFMPNEITTLELMEDVIFDKVSSRLMYDILSIKLIIPADKFPTGLRRVVATFKYKDLAAYFDTKPKEAIWVNVQNNAGNIKLTEAFELRQFGSRIVKLENPDDANVDDIYNKTPRAGLVASDQLEQELIELEYFLWEN